MARAKSMLVGGTASHVGKSWMTTAICRWVRRQGLSVAPFKAQNMSNNSYPCVGGGEIGRAQVAQAEACGLEPEPDMNPLLLKPNSDTNAQCVVQGKVWRNLSARELYAHHEQLRTWVLESYERLAERFDYVVIEGAGSLAELNFRKTDLVNMGFAEAVDCPALLVADIDRGGVFASVYGTYALLEEHERARIPCFAINRFRGDPGLFEDGRVILEERTGKPCLGVFPYADGIYLDAEDAVSLEEPGIGATGQKIGAVLLPRISNLTDFRLLPSVAWVRDPDPQVFDFVILPGTKNTSADLAWMQERGLDRWVLDQYSRGATLVGICGGYQMLGRVIRDPDRVESDRGSIEGLGLLPVETTLAPQKTTVAVRGVTSAGNSFAAYKIHMGQTMACEPVEPFCTVEGWPEGARGERVVGTYLHGALESPDVVEDVFGFRPATVEKQINYDRLADWFEKSANLDLFRTEYL